MRFLNVFRGKGARDATDREETALDVDGAEKATSAILHDDQQAQYDHDLSVLAGDKSSLGERVQREAEKEVQTAAEDSLRKLHVFQRGHCPKCGEPLRKHLFASVCDGCGWHTFDAPREGPVRVHLAHGAPPVEGERCYVVRSGAVLVLRKDLVVARIPAASVGWVEYVWNDEEVEQRHRVVVDHMAVLCGWCNGKADPEQDGFHLAQVAFGASQERYCFCSDECYEAFRKMFPARVHRNCYERNCAECNLCIKRYGSEAEEVYMLAKDYLSPKADTGQIRKG